MKERIKAVRNELNLTQQAMANALGLKRNTIGAYEIGTITPSDRTISDICRIYNVNEVWLRKGEGEMFVPRTREDEIGAFLGELAGGKGSDFQRRFVAVLARLSADEWAMIERKAQELMDEKKDPVD